jgi:hypothetical protein
MRRIMVSLNMAMVWKVKAYMSVPSKISPIRFRISRYEMGAMVRKAMRRKIFAKDPSDLQCGMTSHDPVLLPPPLFS